MKIIKTIAGSFVSLLSFYGYTVGEVVLSVRFRLKNRDPYHIVSLAGFVTDKSEDITHFIIDDPHGDFQTDYQYQPYGKEYFRKA